MRLPRPYYWSEVVHLVVLLFWVDTLRGRVSIGPVPVFVVEACQFPRIRFPSCPLLVPPHLLMAPYLLNGTEGFQWKSILL